MRRQLRPTVSPAHLPVLAVLVALGVPALAGCSSPPQESVSTDLTQVTVSAVGAGVAPTVEVPAPFAAPTSASRVVEEGDGRVVAEGDVIGMQYVLLNGRTGEPLDSSDWAAEPTSLVVDESILVGLRAGLVDKTVGSEVLVAVAPQDGFEAQASPAQEGIEASDTLIFYIDVVSAVPPRAQGVPVPPQPGLPTVTLAADGAPTIAIPPGSEPPAELVIQRLIEGAGPVVEVGQTVVVQYTGVKYADGAVFDSSWTNGEPFTEVIGAGRVISAWDVGIVGLPVGSQVLMIVPPADGYGDVGQPLAGISGTDTLVFVVDVLAAG